MSRVRSVPRRKIEGGEGRIAVARGALVVMSALVLVGCDTASDRLKRSGSRAGPTQIQTVNVIPIRFSERVSETVTFFGSLQPNRQTHLAFGRSGQVLSVFAQVGDRAVAGEQLAALGQGELEDQSRQIQAAIDDAGQGLQANNDLRSAATLERIRELEAQLNAINAELGKGILAAPYDCVIAEKFVEVGSAVSPQVPAFRVLEDATPVVEAHLPRRIAEVLTTGQSATVVIGDRSLPAAVRTVSPLETTSGSKAVSLRIAPPQESSWSFGQIVQVRFVLATEKSGYWLPLTALHRDANGLWSTFVVARDATTGNAISDDGGFEVARKTLELVQLDDNRALVRGPLSEGELVIVNGTHRVVPGQSVAINDVTASSAIAIPGESTSDR
jgi:multidrug efflux pump subunit AcrA (membrane-fusion protein)